MDSTAVGVTKTKPKGKGRQDHLGGTFKGANATTTHAHLPIDLEDQSANTAMATVKPRRSARKAAGIEVLAGGCKEFRTMTQYTQG